MLWEWIPTIPWPTTCSVRLIVTWVGTKTQSGNCKSPNSYRKAAGPNPNSFGTRRLLRSGGCRARLLFRQAVHPILREFVQKYQERPIGPAEADHVLLISSVDARLRGTGHHVVFLSDSSVVAEILRDRAQEIVRNPIGVIVEPVAPQTLNGDNLGRRPAVGIIPLHLCIRGAHRQPPWLFEKAQVMHQFAGFLGTCDPGP